MPQELAKNTFGDTNNLGENLKKGQQSKKTNVCLYA